MYERKHHPLLPRKQFAARMLRHSLFALAFVVGSLLLGIAGYHHFERLSYLDSLLNASMLLGGMGPVSELKTTGGKLFASFYALFSGIGFLVIAGVLFAPAIHRFFHKFHLEMADDEGGGASRAAARSSYRQRVTAAGKGAGERATDPCDDESSN